MLDNSKIEVILKNLYKGEDVSLVELVHKSAKVVGENWCNELVILDIKAKIGSLEKVFRWLGKFPPEDESRRRFNLSAHLEETEVGFYSYFVPKMKEFIQARISLNICPVYHAEYSEDGCSFFIMENLKESGYLGSVDKIPGLDFEHCKRVVEELARFHAASHAYITKSSEDEKLKLLKRDFVFLEAEEAMTKYFDDFGQERLHSVRQTLESIQESGENWTDKFSELVRGRSSRKMLVDAMARNPDGFNVQVHNDLWICNMLFNYETDNKPKSVCFVDWAVTSWNNPALDLTNFMMTSANPDVLNNHFPELMQIYHSILMTSLEKLGIDNIDYSLDDLLQDYDVKIFWASLNCLTWIPVNLGDKDDFAAVTEDYGDLSQGDNFGRYICAVSKIILDKKGATHPYLRPRLRAIFTHVLQRTMS